MRSQQRENLCPLRRIGAVRNAKVEIVDDLQTPPEEGQEPGTEGPEPPSSKYNNFTDLTRSREDVFLATEHTGVYK